VLLPAGTRILLWSLLSGVLWALAWPAVGGMFPLAFVAWLPLMHAQRLHDSREGRKRAFMPYVLAALLLWNATCSWWFYCVSEPLPTKLVSVLAPVLVNTLLMSIPWWLQRIVKRVMGPRIAAWSFLVFWLAFERLHHGWDLQWPWFSLGNVFANAPSWIQWYAWTGMLGGSLWILLVTLVLDRSIARYIGKDREHPRMRVGAVAVLLIALPLGISLWTYHGHVDEGREAEVVVVQPNIDPYSEKFGGMDPLLQLEGMLDLAATAMTERTALVVMPETALQENATVDLSSGSPELHGLWENDLMRSRSAQRIRQFQAAHHDVAVLTGMSSAYLFPMGTERPLTARKLWDTGYWYEAYNAALFLPSNGKVEHYHKSKLVAGVEAMPFQRVLGSLEHLALDLGGTTGSLGQQSERSVLRDPGNGVAIIPAICYESVFGEHVAAHVRNGGNLIAVMTNDAWWGDSPGYRQHLSFSRIRAIETRRCVARAANTGISCFVDQRGDLHEVSDWWVPDARRRTVHLNERLTFFVRNGDLVGRVAVLLSPLLLLFVLVRSIRQRSAHR
jgi:apolipoprotein N-acyltransferase